MKKDKGFTLVELLICCAIGGILLAVAFGVKDESYAPLTKESCISGGGTWTTGIQAGRMTQLCTYKQND